MKRLRAFLDRFTLGRPPTGPLTTQEQSEADAAASDAAEENERKEREQRQPAESP